MKQARQGNLFDQADSGGGGARRAVAPDTIDATVTLSVRQLEALVEPLVQRAVERALDEHMPASAGIASHVPVAVAARLLGMAPKTVANMLSDGRLTRYGAPRRPLVALEEIQAITHSRGRETAILPAVRPRSGRGQRRAATFSARARAE